MQENNLKLKNESLGKSFLATLSTKHKVEIPVLFRGIQIRANVGHNFSHY